MEIDFNKLKIGIGICTCNRISLLQKLLNSVVPHLKKNEQLFIADDGSVDGTVEFLNTSGYEFISGKHIGVAHNKNKIINRFSTFDFIFILEDDLTILQPGWIQHYIKTCLLFDIHYVGFCPGGRYGNINMQEQKEDCVLQVRQYDGDLLRVMSKKAIDTCGGYNLLFRGSGWAHDEFLDRVNKSGINHKYQNALHVQTAEKFLQYQHTASTVRVSDQVEQEKRNRILLDELKKTAIIYCPFN